jgi:hypothetical protein
VAERPETEDFITEEAVHTWDIELRVTITRDVKRVECEAATADEVRAACAKQFPNYRVFEVKVRCDHPACWGPCGTCGAHVHEEQHGRFCPNCGEV